MKHTKEKQSVIDEYTKQIVNTIDQEALSKLTTSKLSNESTPEIDGLIDRILKLDESTDSDDEFTASNMRKRISYKNLEANMIEIDDIKDCIKKQCDIETDYYLYKYSMNEFTSQYFRSRGFKIEHDFKCFDKTYTKISWE